MRTEFLNELKELHKELLKMGTVIEKTVDLLLEGIKAKNIETLKYVMQRDDIVDELEYNIEKKCLNLILMQQPVAADLRTIASILKIITDLERIADHCTDIAGYEIKLIESNYIKDSFDISPVIGMLKQIQKMITATIDCYIKLDAQQAVKISNEDDIVDKYFKNITQQIKLNMKKNADFIDEGIYLLYIIKYAERMADHTTNICEWIAYRVTGEHKQYN